MRSSRCIWGLLFLLFGCLLLLRNVQMFSINASKLILSISLIIIGFLILLGMILTKKPGVEKIITPLEKIKEAHVEINHAVGNLNIHSIPPTNELLKGKFIGGINYDVVTIEDRAFIKLRVPSDSYLREGLWKCCRGNRLDWDIGLNPRVKVFLHLVNKTDTIELNLADLHLEELFLDLSVNNTVIRLPHNFNKPNIRLKTLIAAIEVIVPKDRGVSIQVESGNNLVSIDRERFTKVKKGRYQSNNYEGSEDQIEVMVEANLSLIKIR